MQIIIYEDKIDNFKLCNDWSIKIITIKNAFIVRLDDDHYIYPKNTNWIIYNAYKYLLNLSNNI